MRAVDKGQGLSVARDRAATSLPVERNMEILKNLPEDAIQSTTSTQYVVGMA